jgi:hypothetical protein
MMKLAMMERAKRDDIFVAHFLTQATSLCNREE